MKLFFKSILITASVFVFSSCEDVVQIKLDEGNKLYVIDAFINSSREDQIIKITSNSNYFSNSNPAGIAGASVVLTDLTANKQFVFLNSGNGNYIYNLTASDTLAKANHSYHLSIMIDGVNYTASALQKRYASIDSIGYFLNDQDFGFGPPPKDTSFLCILYAKDKADKDADYYWIKTFRNDTLMEGVNLCIDGTGAAVTDPPSDSLIFTPPATYLNFESFLPRDNCRVEVHSIELNTYNFLLQALIQISNGGLFATTPENVRTNFISPEGKTKAVGWFSIASVASKSITID